MHNDDTLRRYLLALFMCAGLLAACGDDGTPASPTDTAVADDVSDVSDTAGLDTSPRLTCEDAPCLNGGTCTDIAAGFECACANGWTGATCQQDIDDCEGVTCGNGTCVDAVGGFSCECTPGYYGGQCDGEDCGDGVRTANEACDDGGNAASDGCAGDCSIEWANVCVESDGLSVCAPECGDGLRADEEGCDDGNQDSGDACSGDCEVETPVTFACAITNHEAQQAAAPDFIYAAATGGVSLDGARQPERATWEPILESAPGCNGLAYDPDATDPPLKEFKFLIVLDASWVSHYEEHAEHFALQGYPSLQASPGVLLDRVSFLYETQFGVRISASRVEAFPNLLEKCAENDANVENGVPDETHTPTAMAERGISWQWGEAGIVRLGVGAEDHYCHSSAPLGGLCSTALMTNQQRVFVDSSGRFNHRAASTLAHEFAHYFGICGNESHPHCLNAHTANEIPDIMVWDGTPAVAVRPDGLFYKFMPSCTPLYDTLVCGTVKSSPAACSTDLTCDNGGLDCSTTYWSTAGSVSSLAAVPREVMSRGELLAVRCCNEAGSACTSAGLSGIETLAGDAGCSGPMTWPDADRFCRGAGLRLCTADELEADVCAGSGCGYDEARVWTGSPGPLDTGE